MPHCEVNYVDTRGTWNIFISTINLNPNMDKQSDAEIMYPFPNFTFGYG